MLRRFSIAGWLAAVAVAACESNAPSIAEPVGPNDNCAYDEALDSLAAPASYEYAWSCSDEVPASGAPLPDASVPDDCTTGVWPDLDDTTDVCPTVTDVVRTDPVSGRDLPTSDDRELPTEIPVAESGSFLPPSAPEAFPSSLRVVAWNMEYTDELDAQIEVLTTHPELSKGDVYLLSEVDRCSTRSDMRRSARELAQALEGTYAYAIEFVELNIGRDIGGDTGQAIIARRPLTGAAVTCQSSQYDWFESEEEPRLGQRIAVHADLPVGDTSARVYAVHLESNDLFGDLRSVQGKELLDAAQTYACERPQIIAGDFNAPYCGAPELEILRDSGFVDAIGVTGDVEATHSGGFRLDYVFVRGFEVVDGGVVRDLGASDHHALWVDLELEQ
jgi:endonuclease/exonuclease/phosphatase family metal-dependent hydrolase